MKIYLFFRYTFLDNDLGKQKIPLSRGLETRVIIGGIMSGTFRSIVETPLEYAKVDNIIRTNKVFSKIKSLHDIKLDSKTDGSKLHSKRMLYRSENHMDAFVYSHADLFHIPRLVQTQF